MKLTVWCRDDRAQIKSLKQNKVFWQFEFQIENLHNESFFESCIGISLLFDVKLLNKIMNNALTKNIEMFVSLMVILPARCKLFPEFQTT